MAHQMYCINCGRDRRAEHVHGAYPNSKGGRDHRFKRWGCWNRCLGCGQLYEAPPCTSLGTRSARAAELELEAAGQLRLFDPS